MNFPYILNVRDSYKYEKNYIHLYFGISRLHKKFFLIIAIIYAFLLAIIKAASKDSFINIFLRLYSNPIGKTLILLVISLFFAIAVIQLYIYLWIKKAFRKKKGKSTSEEQIIFHEDKIEADFSIKTKEFYYKDIQRIKYNVTGFLIIGKKVNKEIPTLYIGSNSEGSKMIFEFVIKGLQPKQIIEV